MRKSNASAPKTPDPQVAHHTRQTSQVSFEQRNSASDTRMSIRDSICRIRGLLSPSRDRKSTSRPSSCASSSPGLKVTSEAACKLEIDLSSRKRRLTHSCVAIISPTASTASSPQPTSPAPVRARTFSPPLSPSPLGTSPVLVDKGVAARASCDSSRSIEGVQSIRAGWRASLSSLHQSLSVSPMHKHPSQIHSSQRPGYMLPASTPRRSIQETTRADPALKVVVEEPTFDAGVQRALRSPPPTLPLPALPRTSTSSSPIASLQTNRSPNGSRTSMRSPPFSRREDLTDSTVQSPSISEYPVPVRHAGHLSWEDDVEYSYEQQAEADSDFDWCNIASPIRPISTADVRNTIDRNRLQIARRDSHVAQPHVVRTERGLKQAVRLVPPHMESASTSSRESPLAVVNSGAAERASNAVVHTASNLGNSLDHAKHAPSASIESDLDGDIYRSSLLLDRLSRLELERQKPALQESRNQELSYDISQVN